MVLINFSLVVYNTNASSPHVARVKMSVLDRVGNVVSHLRRTILRSSVAENKKGRYLKIIASGVVMALLASGGAAAKEDSRSWFNDDTLLTMYGGVVRDTLPESTGAYVTKVGGKNFTRYGDYHGKSTNIFEDIYAFSFGTGLHVRDGIETKVLFFHGPGRASTRDVVLGKETLYRASGQLSIFLSVTKELFSFSDVASFHIGPSLNYHHVDNTVSANHGQQVTDYESVTENGQPRQVTSIAQDWDYWGKSYPWLPPGDKGATAHGDLSPGLLWQVDLDRSIPIYSNLYSSVSYVGTVSLSGTQTHMLFMRFKFGY